MKKVLFPLLLCIVLLSCFFVSEAQPAGKLQKPAKVFFPKNVVYSVVSKAKNEKIIAEAFNDKLVFKSNGTTVAEFIYIGPLPKPPSPCEPAICYKLKLTLKGKNNYSLVIDGSNTEFSFASSSISEQFSRYISNSVNKEVMLQKE